MERGRKEGSSWWSVVEEEEGMWEWVRRRKEKVVRRKERENRREREDEEGEKEKEHGVERDRGGG